MAAVTEMVGVGDQSKKYPYLDLYPFGDVHKISHSPKNKTSVSMLIHARAEKVLIPKYVCDGS